MGTGTAQLAQLTLAGGKLTGSANATLVIGANLGGASAGAITIDNGSTLSGDGAIAGAAIIDNGSLLASAGTLAIASAVSGSGGAVIENGASLNDAAAFTLSEVTFTGAGELGLAAPASFTGTVDGFGSGDQIDLGKLAATSLSFAGGTLTVHDGAAVVDQLHFAGSYTSADFGLAADSHGGSLINFVAADALSDFTPSVLTVQDVSPGGVASPVVAGSIAQIFDHSGGFGHPTAFGPFVIGQWGHFL
jgi:hypothetical protein